jgi:predicted lipoprotein with Yx(FWY)xxD motif
MRPLALAILAAALLATPAFAASPRAKVLVRVTSVGGVLVDARGHTLYSYAPDKARRSSCYGGCAALWPAFVTTAKPAAGVGVKPGLLGVAKRTDGKLQVTYAGHPLYLYSGESKAGQLKGQGIDGMWWALAASGAKVTRTATTTPPPPTTTDPGYGYGNGY